MQKHQENVRKVLSVARAKISKNQLMEAAHLLAQLNIRDSINQQLTLVTRRLNEINNYEILFGPGKEEHKNHCAWSLAKIVDSIEAEIFQHVGVAKSSIESYPNIISRGETSLKEELRYTCGRYDQTRMVDPFNLNRPPISFFLLHGDIRQSHHGFLQRIESEMKGSFFRVKSREMKFLKYQIWCPALNEELSLFDKRDLVAKTCEELHLDPDENYPLEDQKFGGLLRIANPQSDLNKKDVIIFSIKVNFEFWNRGGRKQLMEWLSSSFFTPQALTPETPRILVFWSLVYHPWHSSKPGRSDLESALSELSVEFSLLPELKPEGKSNVADWLAQRKIDESQIYQLIHHIFGDKETIDPERLVDR